MKTASPSSLAEFENSALASLSAGRVSRFESNCRDLVRSWSIAGDRSTPSLRQPGYRRVTVGPWLCAPALRLVCLFRGWRGYRPLSCRCLHRCDKLSGFRPEEKTSASQSHAALLRGRPTQSRLWS